MTSITPMLASVGDELPRGDGWVFEPKYDGVRVLAFADGATSFRKSEEPSTAESALSASSCAACGSREKRAFFVIAYEMAAPARHSSVKRHR